MIDRWSIEEWRATLNLLTVQLEILRKRDPSEVDHESWNLLRAMHKDVLVKLVELDIESSERTADAE